MERWRSAFAAWRSSGLSVAAFCRSHDLNRPSFYRWRKIRDDQHRPVANRTRSQPDPLTVQFFVPVRVIPDTVVELVPPSGVRLRVPLSAGAPQLARLVRALGGPPCRHRRHRRHLRCHRAARRRKGIDGLAGVVRTPPGRDPGSGDLFVFKNRRDELMILAWMATLGATRAGQQWHAYWKSAA